MSNKIPLLANTIVASNIPTLLANLYNYKSVALWANADIFYALGNAAITANSANVATNHFLPGNTRVEFTLKRYPGTMDDLGYSHISVVRSGSANVSVYLSAYDED